MAAAAPEALTAPAQTFANAPAFPDNVPTAPLLRLSLAKLVARDAEEVNRFVRACEDLGFFYLDLTGPGDALLADADRLFDLGAELFELPLEEKQKYDFVHKKSYFGYKGFGVNFADRQGNKDRNEFYNVSKDDMLELSEPWPAPDVLQSRRPLLKSFMVRSQEIVLLVLELLNDYLGLAPNTLQDKHRMSERSGDQIRLIKAPPQPADDRRIALGEHTDFGSVTVLFNRLGGLQVLPPGRDAEWCYVKPLPNHAIINLGDAMVKFTNGLLRSNIHRIMAPPGAQGDHARYSVMYFSRPEDEVLLKRLDGSDKMPPLGADEVEEDIKSKDWVIRRALGSRIALHENKNVFDFDRFKGTEETSQRSYL